MDARLPTWIWVDALLARVRDAGAAAFVTQKGDRERGDVLVKVATLDRMARAFAKRTNMDGVSVFVDLAVQGVGPDEAGVDDYVVRAKERDSDLWIIEIEDRAGRHFLTEPVEGKEGSAG